MADFVQCAIFAYNELAILVQRALLVEVADLPDTVQEVPVGGVLKDTKYRFGNVMTGRSLFPRQVPSVHRRS